MMTPPPFTDKHPPTKQEELLIWQDYLKKLIATIWLYFYFNFPLLEQWTDSIFQDKGQKKMQLSTFMETLPNIIKIVMIIHFVF